MSGLSASVDVVDEAREGVDVGGHWGQRARARRLQVGLGWVGMRDAVVFVNEDLRYPRGDSEPVLAALNLGMMVTFSRVFGHRRRRLIERVNRAFGLELPDFPPVSSHAGYFVSIGRRLGGEELQRLAQLTGADLQALLPHLPGQHAPLRQLLAALAAAAAPTAGHRSRQARPPAFTPMRLVEAAGTEPADPTEASTALAQSRLLREGVTQLETLGALCQLLGDGDGDGRLHVRVCNAACQEGLERLEAFRLAYAGAGQRLAAGDGPPEVVRRLEQAASLLDLLAQGLEALDADVIAELLDADHLRATGEQLAAAWQEANEAISWGHLQPRERLCLWRQPSVFAALSPCDQAAALALFMALQAEPVSPWRRDRVAARLAKLGDELAAWRLPTAQADILRRQEVHLAAAWRALATVPEAGTTGEWAAAAPPRPQRPPPPASCSAAGAAPPPEPSVLAMRRLSLYEVGILVQDDADMDASLQRAAAESLAEVVAQAAPPALGGHVQVHFVHDVLAGLRPVSVASRAAAAALPWQASSGRAMVGNAAEQLLYGLAADLRAGKVRRPLALVVIATGKMVDAAVLGAAGRRLAAAMAPGFSDEVVVGFIEVAGSARARGPVTATLAHLDAADDDGGLRVEANTDVDQPIAQRVQATLRGMMDPAIDLANDNHNRANGLRARVRYWF